MRFAVCVLQLFVFCLLLSVSSREAVCLCEVFGKRLSTCPQILMIQKAFLQSSVSYDLISGRCTLRNAELLHEEF